MTDVEALRDAIAEEQRRAVALEGELSRQREANLALAGACEFVANRLEETEVRSLHPISGELMGRRPAAQQMIDRLRAALARLERAE